MWWSLINLNLRFVSVNTLNFEKFMKLKIFRSLFLLFLTKFFQKHLIFEIYIELANILNLVNKTSVLLSSQPKIEYTKLYVLLFIF